MLNNTKGLAIQVDRLTLYGKSQPKPIPNILPNLSNKTNEISHESHVSFPSNNIKIIRLTFEDLNSNEKLIYNKTEETINNSIRQQSLVNLNEENKEKDEYILSPIYESIDERRNSINLLKNKKEMKTYDKQFETLY
ncbi:unnamed protein product [Adineta steineri]|uniref:Uncharacterized protein n=1 Tax=Adineta steineri TaxID=433720 RepID=A0A818MBC3_9BILA|nr:unnamed protein product [Adineta steineri]CAF0897693.1 unnamed protein product [Adineta steineri]CAF0897768.1 unnamed protein product [Adineta steineri]CAF3586045.1 unnamed protein product [Adineta steineri]CAF3586115.1 unnamed protein product [Adineta steineri]